MSELSEIIHLFRMGSGIDFFVVISAANLWQSISEKGKSFELFFQLFFSSLFHSLTLILFSDYWQLYF